MDDALTAYMLVSDLFLDGQIGARYGCSCILGTTIILLFVTWIGNPIMSGLLGFYLYADRGRHLRSLRPSCRTRAPPGVLLAASCFAAYTLGANNTGMLSACSTGCIR